VHIFREEFASLVEEHSKQLEIIQRSKLLTYLRVAAYAEEYRSEMQEQEHLTQNGR
jgi:hypothetical protein